jgi:hypothetical protein
LAFLRKLSYITIAITAANNKPLVLKNMSESDEEDDWKDIYEKQEAQDFNQAVNQTKRPSFSYLESQAPKRIDAPPSVRTAPKKVYDEENLGNNCQ